LQGERARELKRRSKTMNVSEVMSRKVRLGHPRQGINEVARIMADIDAGLVPVGENDRLVGMITDRDIAIRAVAAGKGPNTSVREVMTQDVKYCYEDDDVADVAENMAKLQLRRLPVLNCDKRLVGIVALSDIAIAAGPEPAGAAVEAISQPRG
jgi:CBS domain-containing protein